MLKAKHIADGSSCFLPLVKLVDDWRRRQYAVLLCKVRLLPLHEVHVEQILLGDPFLVDHLHDLVLDLHFSDLHLLLVVSVQPVGHRPLFLFGVVVP